MDKVSSENDKPKDSLGDPGHEQFPVDTYVTKVRLVIDDAGVELARIVVMNGQAAPGRPALREYYYGNTGVSIDGVTSLSMHVGTIEPIPKAIDRFVGTMPMHLDVSQSFRWHRGVYNPSGARRRLYKATDPDDSTKMIGLLIEQDLEGRITKITWYKTGEAKALFHSRPGKLTFELVKDENGAPSLDPNDIGGWTWYYTTSVGDP